MLIDFCWYDCQCCTVTDFFNVSLALVMCCLWAHLLSFVWKCHSSPSFTHPPCSTQPPPAYSHPSTATYSVQPASAVGHAVTASYAPAPVQAARPVVSAPYAAYQNHQAPPEYAYRQPDPPAPPQPTTTPQTYQVYSDTVSLLLLLWWFLPLFIFVWCRIKQVDVVLGIVTLNAVISLSTTIIWMKFMCECQQDNYNYGRPPAVTSFDNKQFYQTSIASAQRTPTETYYQTGEVSESFCYFLDTFLISETLIISIKSQSY